MIINILRANVMSIIEGLTVLIAQKSEGKVSFEQLWASEDERRKLDIYYREAISDLEGKLMKWLKGSHSQFNLLTVSEGNYELDVQVSNWPEKLGGLLGNKVQDYLVHAILAGWLNNFAGLEIKQDYAGMAAQDLDDIWTILSQREFKFGESNRRDDAARAKQANISFNGRRSDSDEVSEDKLYEAGERNGDAARAKHGSISFEEREEDSNMGADDSETEASERKGDDEDKNLIAGRTYAGRRRADRVAVKQAKEERTDRRADDIEESKDATDKTSERNGDAARARQNTISFTDRQDDADHEEKGDDADASERKGDDEDKNLIAGRAYAGRRRADKEAMKQNTDEAGERNGDAARAKQGDVTFEGRQEDAARAKQGSISFDGRQGDDVLDTDEKGTDASERKCDDEDKNLIAGRAYAGRRRADKEAMKQNTDEAGERNGDAARAKQGSISFEGRQEDAARAKQSSISFEEREEDSFRGADEEGHIDASERKGDDEDKNLIAGRTHAGRRRADDIDTGRSAEADSGERKKDCVPIFHHRDTTDWSGEGIRELMHRGPHYPQNLHYPLEKQRARQRAQNEEEDI